MNSRENRLEHGTDTAAGISLGSKAGISSGASSRDGNPGCDSPAWTKGILCPGTGVLLIWAKLCGGRCPMSPFPGVPCPCSRCPVSLFPDGPCPYLQVSCVPIPGVPGLHFQVSHVPIPSVPCPCPGCFMSLFPAPQLRETVQTREIKGRGSLGRQGSTGRLSPWDTKSGKNKKEWS